MKKSKNKIHESYSKYLFEPNIVFNTLSNTLLENTNLKSDFNYVDISGVVSSFSKRIYAYDCENSLNTEIELSVIVNQGKGDLFELLLSKSDIRDITFFNKFISCYMFSDTEYDDEVIDFLLRYSLNSSDASLNQSGIALFSLSSHDNSYIYNKYKNTKFESDFLNCLFDKAVKENEKVC